MTRVETKCLRRVVRRVVAGIVHHIQDYLACFAELHWMEGDGSLNGECLMEYSPAQPPMITVICKGKVGIVSIAGEKTRVTVVYLQVIGS